MPKALSQVPSQWTRRRSQGRDSLRLRRKLVVHQRRSTRRQANGGGASLRDVIKPEGPEGRNVTVPNTFILENP